MCRYGRMRSLDVVQSHKIMSANLICGLLPWFSFIACYCKIRVHNVIPRVHLLVVVVVSSRYNMQGRKKDSFGNNGENDYTYNV